MDKVIIVPIAEWDALQARITELEAVASGKPSTSVIGTYPHFTRIRILNPDEAMEKLCLELDRAITTVNALEKETQELTNKLIDERQKLHELSVHWFYGIFFKNKKS